MGMASGGGKSMSMNEWLQQKSGLPNGYTQYGNQILDNRMIDAIGKPAWYGDNGYSTTYRTGASLAPDYALKMRKWEINNQNPSAPQVTPQQTYSTNLNQSRLLNAQRLSRLYKN